VEWGAGVVRRVLLIPLILSGMIALVGVTLGQIYAGPLLTQLVAGAAIGSVGLSVAARRLPNWQVAPLSVVGLAGYTALAMYLAARRAGVPGPLGEVFLDAARNGIPRLLTAMIPVEPLPDTVVVPVAAAWLAGFAAAEVALRAGRLLLGYVPSTLLYAGALYVMGPNAESALWPPVAFAALGIAGLALTARPATTPAETAADTAAGPDDGVRRALRLRIVAGHVIGLVTVLALAAGLAPLVSERVNADPVDPRRYVQPPQVESLDESPLIRISGWALNPDQKLLDITTEVMSTNADPPPPEGETADDVADDVPDDVASDVTGGVADEAESTADGDTPVGAGIRIRLAVLHDYDGVTWKVGATYRNAGRVLPPVTPHPDATVDTIRQEITIAELTGRLLPAVATPQRVDGARVAYDPESGTLIRPEGLTPGLRYTVTSVRERPDYNQLSAANVPAGDEVARVLHVGDGVPEQMQRLAEKIAAENGAPYQRALAIEQFLSEHYRFVADAPSGHAYPNLAFFLFGPREAGGQRGTSEQFAAAFAVLGRLVGLPTRVVVGFRPPTGNGPVRAGDASAWPEVLFSGLGWVPFDPLPQPDNQPRPVEEEFKPQPEPSTPPPSPEQTPPVDPTTPSGPELVLATPPRRGPSAPVLAGFGLGTLILLAASAAITILLLRRALRRRRLSEGPPEARVVGAWLEVMDALRLARHPAAAHLSASEVAAHARQVNVPSIRPAVPPIDELAGLLNHLTFGAATVDEDQARAAVAQARAYTEKLRDGQPWWRRLWWSLHLGPLRWHR